MDLLNQQYSFSIPGYLVVVLGAVLLTIFFANILIIRRFMATNTMYQVKTSPKYGFLGKPLYAMVTLVLMVGALGFVLLNFNTTDTNFISKAEKVVTIAITAQTLSSNGDAVHMSFSAVPQVDNTDWGNTADKFDFFWELKGPDIFSKPEYQKSKDDKSGFTRVLRPGKYNVSVVMSYQNKSYNAQKTIEVK